jgi:predicted TIM-barrel fold metal-dependent hydrolase/NAD-dependent dihydropyrimidine dehydrogenase PreA subunit
MLDGKILFCKKKGDGPVTEWREAKG